MKTSTIRSLLAGVFVVSAIGLVGTDASAGLCQIISDEWPETIWCGGEGQQYYGVASAETENGNKSLGVVLLAGDWAGAVGLTSTGAVINNCRAIDETVDGLTSVVDVSGCNSATGFALNVGY